MQEITIQINEEVIDEIEEVIPHISEYLLENCVHFGTAAVIVQAIVNVVEDLKQKLQSEDCDAAE
jgi:hypothetical protein